MDGSPSGEAPVELEDVAQPVVLTRAQVVGLEAVEPGSSIGSCLQKWKKDALPATPAVRRVGAHTETVTFRDVSGQWLLGCDDSSGPTEEDRRWCGSAVGRLYGGRLRDPRINIVGCRTADGDRVGFAWVHPSPDARYVGVEQAGYTEVYEVAGDMPIRIATTSGVIIEGSRSRFDLSEHDRDGNLIREYQLDAPVAG